MNFECEIEATSDEQVSQLTQEERLSTRSRSSSGHRNANENFRIVEVGSGEERKITAYDNDPYFEHFVGAQGEPFSPTFSPVSLEFIYSHEELELMSSIASFQQTESDEFHNVTPPQSHKGESSDDNTSNVATKARTSHRIERTPEKHSEEFKGSNFGNRPTLSRASTVKLSFTGHGRAKDDSNKIYTVYILHVSPQWSGSADDTRQHGRNKPWKVYRRYRQFHELYLTLQQKGYHVPPLPPKRFIGSFEPEFVYKRLKDLSKWMNQLLQPPKIANCESTPKDTRLSTTMRRFLTADADVRPRGLEKIHYLTTDSDVSRRKSSSNIADGETLEKEQHETTSARNSSQSIPKPNMKGKGVELTNFELCKVIGKGSYGKVLLVRDRYTGEQFAMKVLDKRNITRRKQIVHTNTERRVLGFTRHPFIVRLHYAFQTRNQLYLILDYCSGGEIFFHLSLVGAFNEEAVAFYGAEIILALDHLHTLGVVYRDLKPENILLDKYGHIRLTDFGLSKILEELPDVRIDRNQHTPAKAKSLYGDDKIINEKTNDEDIYKRSVRQAQRTFSFCGTPEYLAPEILEKKGHGIAVDWWSLGMVLHEMLTGLPPWYTKDRDRLFDDICNAELKLADYLSETVKDLLQNLLQRNPKKRLGSRHETPRTMMRRLKSIAGFGKKKAERLPIDLLKGHPFFSEIDFEKLLTRKVKTPFIPKAESSETERESVKHVDTPNFSKKFTSMPIPMLSKEKDDPNQRNFRRFSFEASDAALYQAIPKSYSPERRERKFNT